MANKRVEFDHPFIRFLRWNGKPIAKEPIAVKTGTDYTFVVSASPIPLAPPTAVVVDIITGDAIGVAMTQLGTGGQLWEGTIPAGTFGRNGVYLLRALGHNDNATCEVELKTKP